MLADYWFETLSESPDMTFRFEAKQIKVRSDGTSVLSGIYQFGGTLILESEDQKRRKADWSYMTSSFRLEGNEITPVGSLPHQPMNQSTNCLPSSSSQQCDEGSEEEKKKDDAISAAANAFLSQHILQHGTKDSGNKPVIIDYKTEGIFSLAIDAEYRLDSVEATLDRYYLNHQLAPWLQGPSDFAEFRQSFF